MSIQGYQPQCERGRTRRGRQEVCPLVVLVLLLALLSSLQGCGASTVKPTSHPSPTPSPRPLAAAA